MKPETAAALRKLDLRQSRELVAFMADIMATDEFCNALMGAPQDGNDPELTADGDNIWSEMLERHGSHLIDPERFEIDQLHEAICEGRAQDALDILMGATGEDLRPAHLQNRLFPQRAPITKLEF